MITVIFPVTWLWRYCNTRSGWSMGRCYWHRIPSFPLLLHWKYTLCSYISAENDEKNEITEYATFYHYTTAVSAVQIGHSQKIRQSEDKNHDAINGPGTYLTQLSPSHSKHEVAKNNYDTNSKVWKSNIAQGKTDACIELVLPKNEVEDCSSKLKRDVHLYHGSIDLTKVKCQRSLIKTGDTTYIALPQV